MDVVAAMTRRLDLVTGATRILLENVTYSEPVAVQQCARLLARELAAWVIVDVERQGKLHRQAVAGPEDQRSQELARAAAAIDPRPESAPGQVHDSGSSLLLAHAEDLGVLGEGPDGVPLLMAFGASSLLCVPLSDGERSYGVLTLAGQAGGGRFGMADAGLVEELGEQLALAIRADRLFRRRSEVADALQASLLPRQLRQIPGTEVAAAHVPASNEQEVGGDFYDVYPAGADGGRRSATSAARARTRRRSPRRRGTRSGRSRTRPGIRWPCCAAPTRSCWRRSSAAGSSPPPSATRGGSAAACTWCWPAPATQGRC